MLTSQALLLPTCATLRVGLPSPLPLTLKSLWSILLTAALKLTRQVRLSALVGEVARCLARDAGDGRGGEVGDAPVTEVRQVVAEAILEFVVIAARLGVTEGDGLVGDDGTGQGEAGGDVRQGVAADAARAACHAHRPGGRWPLWCRPWFY